MDLVVAEKPSVARDLARVLGVPRRGDWFENAQYAITWCIGHLVELDEPAAYDERWKPWRLDALPMLPAEFGLHPAKHATAQLQVVRDLLRDRRFAGVINACDAGREGELIFRYVYQYARSKLPIRRLWISSLTDDAIRRGIGSLRPGRELEPLADAARSRSEADWLVGMNATRALTIVNRTRAREAGVDDGRDGHGGDRDDARRAVRGPDNGRQRGRSGPSRGAGGALLSIGRVQTPTLALIVGREREIERFVPRDYWEIRGDFVTAEGMPLVAWWRSGAQPRLDAAALAGAIATRDAAATDERGPRVVAVRSRTVREPPPQLFDLTSLQRTANRRFGWAAARTLEIAQGLYERHKVITYPRTDSRHLSRDVAAELPAVFEALRELPDYTVFAQHLIDHPPQPSRRVVDDAKVSDHHAIIPTGTAPRGLDRDEARLFDQIVRRFLGAFYPDAEIAVTEAWIRVGEGDAQPPAFAAADREHFIAALPPPPDHYLARGRVRLVAGWQDVAGIAGDRDRGGDDDPGRGDDRSRNQRGGDGGNDRDEPTGSLPPLIEGQRLAGAYRPVAKQTTPPPRYTEATLLAAMESAGKAIDDEALREAMKDVGLGTPATRAAIIETLLKRQYIERDRQSLVPTPTGCGVIDALEAAQVGTLASPELTGSWEARLARIARGEDARSAFMADIARYVTSVIDALRGGPSPSSMPPAGPPTRSAATSGAMTTTATRASDVRTRSARRSTSTPGATDGSRSRASRSTSDRARSKSATAMRAARERSTANAASSPPLARVEMSPELLAAVTAAIGTPQIDAPNRRPEPPRIGRPPTVIDLGPDRSRIGRSKRPNDRPSTKARSSTAPKSSPAKASPPTAERLGCPRCRQGHLIDGQRGWGCDRWREGCRFVIWYETAGRRLTASQLRALITTGKTRKATFRDAAGIEIDGRLVLDPASAGGVQLERSAPRSGST